MTPTSVQPGVVEGGKLGIFWVFNSFATDLHYRLLSCEPEDDGP